MAPRQGFESCIAIAVCLFVLATGSKQMRPNVVFVFTDDQDQTLGSMEVMNATRRLIGEAGTTFCNNFVNTPICCPSRAEVQTGRHMHNTGVTGNACGGAAFKNDKEKLNVAYYAKTLGNYTNFYAGKYLNNYGSADTGGVGYIPPGWESWYGLVGNSKYYGYTVSNNGVAEHHGSDYQEDYFTDYLANKSVAFIRSRAGKDNPFFVMVGTPSCHIPDDYAPWTAAMFNWSRAPRTPNWNVAPNPDKHPMMRGVQPMGVGDPAADGRTAMYASDWVAIKRWRTLQSVDVMVQRLHDAVAEIGREGNTYFIFSSDNGYHLGQYGLAYDKRQLYEEDIRVPLLVSGPGILQGVVSPIPTMHIDLAPTILAMMGIRTPTQMDGRSWLHHATGDDRGPWRGEMLVEYNGPVFAPGGGSSAVPGDSLEVDVDGRTGLLSVPAHGSAVSGGGGCKWFSKASTSECDPVTNTWACVRSMNSTRVPSERNSVYCEFTNVPSGPGGWSPFFSEYYDIDADPFQLHNLAQDSTINNTAAFVSKMRLLASRLRAHMACKGEGCFDPEPAPPPPPPTPIPGASRFATKTGSGDSQCLTLGPPDAAAAGPPSAVAPEERRSLVLNNCPFAVAWLCDRDDKGNPEIASSAGGAGGALCLNVLDMRCREGATVHAGPCQNSTQHLRTGNHFSWKPTGRLGDSGDAGRIVSNACAGYCLHAAGAGASLTSCSGADAAWTRLPAA